MHGFKRAASAAPAPLFIMSLLFGLAILTLGSTACSDAPTEPEAVLAPDAPTMSVAAEDWIRVENSGELGWEWGGELEYGYQGAPASPMPIVVFDQAFPVDAVACRAIPEIAGLVSEIYVTRFKPVLDGGWVPDDWATSYPWTLTVEQIRTFLDDGKLVWVTVSWHDARPADCAGPNTPPAIQVDAPYVTVWEGDEASVPVYVEDKDGDAITVRSDVGTMTFDQDKGLWTWSMQTWDGPADNTTVSLVADDGRGGEATTSFDLYVTNHPPVVLPVAGLPAGPVPIGTSIDFVYPFTDPAGALDAPYRCAVATNSQTIEGSPATVDFGASCKASYTYTVPGVYSVVAQVQDKDGYWGMAPIAFVVVYDPNGAFVTGGGWFLSLPGMYRPDPTLTGTATFGFVSKYLRGASVPTGNTEFQFAAGDLRFRSTAYEWLVITGKDRAQFKGSGLVNGELAPNGSEYRFMVYAYDDPDWDAVQIRIWWEDELAATEYDVYRGGNFLEGDNGGGSVVIHTK